MNTKQKAALGAVLIAVIFFLTTLLPDLTGTPGATPSPSPSVAVSASPSPIVSVSPSASPSPIVTQSPSPSPSPIVIASPAATNDRYAMRGETLGIDVTAIDGRLPANAKAFEVRTVKTLVGSFKGAPVGDIADPLVPAASITLGKRYYVDIEIPSTQPAGDLVLSILGNPITIHVNSETMPARPTLPVYTELTFAKVSAAYGLADQGATFAARGAINAQFRAMLRAHRIEPIKQWVSSDVSDVNVNSVYGASFLQTVVTGSIADPCIYGPNDGMANLAYKFKQVPNGWAYSEDEKTAAQALSFVKAVAAAAPGIPQFITTPHDASLETYVSRFTPVLDQFNALKETSAFALYTSCMASGTCANGSAGNATGTPNMALDAPAVHARAFPVVVYALGGKHALYYSAIETLKTAWNDGGQYIFGNNGDGNLLYQCPDGSGPCSSLRLKRIRAGSNDVEWLALAKRKGIAIAPPVKSATDWSKDESAYEAMRAQIAGAL